MYRLCKMGAVECQSLVCTLVHVEGAHMVARFRAENWLLPAWVADSMMVESLLLSLVHWSVGTSLNKV